MKAYTLLGQRIAKKDPELALSACMAPEIRELIAYMAMYQTYFGVKDFEAEIEAFRILGRITWPRKELTDLALRVGDNVISAEFEGIDSDNKDDAEEDDL